MSRRIKGEWPYHQKRNGDWVPCDSNPCRRHSSGDIMATSPEDAYAKADTLVAMNGQGFAGMRKVSNKGGDEAHAFAQARRDHDAKVRKAMKGFCADKVKDPAKIPGLFTRDRLGKFTRLYRHADMGGKYLQTRNMDDHKLAKVIEGDVAKLRRAGGVPEGWKVDVKAIDSVESNGFNITISRPEGSTPAFRSIRPTDIYDPNHEGELNAGVRRQMEEDTGIQNCTYRQAASYCRKHPEIRIPTAENEDTVRYVQERWPTSMGFTRNRGISACAPMITEARSGFSTRSGRRMSTTTTLIKPCTAGGRGLNAHDRERQRRMAVPQGPARQLDRMLIEPV